MASPRADPDRTIRASLLDFGRRVAKWWYVVVIGGLGGLYGAAGIAADAISGITLKVPFWAGLTVLGLSVVVVVFLAFHDLRREMLTGRNGTSPLQRSHADALSNLGGEVIRSGEEVVVETSGLGKEKIITRVATSPVGGSGNRTSPETTEPTQTLADPEHS